MLFTLELMCLDVSYMVFRHTIAMACKSSTICAWLIHVPQMRHNQPGYHIGLAIPTVQCPKALHAPSSEWLYKLTSSDELVEVVSSEKLGEPSSFSDG